MSYTILCYFTIITSHLLVSKYFLLLSVLTLYPRWQGKLHTNSPVTCTMNFPNAYQCVCFLSCQFRVAQPIIYLHWFSCCSHGPYGHFYADLFLIFAETSWSLMTQLIGVACALYPGQGVVNGCRLLDNDFWVPIYPFYMA